MTWHTRLALGLGIGGAIACSDGGAIFELQQGSLFYIPAIPHNSWVVGDEPYVALHLMGAEHYAR